MRLIINANASEATQSQELLWHAQSSPLTASHTTLPIHTQEVAGSSPAAPTIKWFRAARRAKQPEYTGRLRKQDRSSTTFGELWTAVCAVKSGCSANTCFPPLATSRRRLRRDPRGKN